MTVTGYLLLEESAADITAVDIERRTIERYAATIGVRLDHLRIEQGTSIRRPFAERTQGRKILAEIEKGDSIVAGKAEWVLSSAREGLHLINMLQERKVALYCADLEENITLPVERKLVVYEGGADLVKRLLISLAACESSSHGDSIRAAKRQMKKEGKYLGGPVPFGWHVKAGFLVQDREQQKVIREIRKLRADRWSYRDIAQKLTHLFGLQLSHEGIRKILLYNDNNK
ncbi:recombinase family protein [Desulfopila inferna]|uniref:recombinase family protein n=1 Tax=Desulfopila inferna TaxID=468528 RepID=UPI0019665710|nr:helix-turn-helix domain-containing protein [Desulfopila inferna]MBM9603446.1 recombinase family protein [Desulfopila inferna]